MNENFNPKIEKPENLSEQMKNIQEVFRLCPELETIGSKEEYEKYLNSIFPESKVKDIVWHGNRENFKDEGFRKDKGRDNKFSDDGQFYGFYFGDYYSHYGRPGNHSYPCKINVHKLKMVNRENGEPFLSGIDTTKNIKDQFNMSDEDGILEIGTFYGNENVPLEKYEERDRKLGEDLFKYLSTLGKNFEDVKNGAQEITMQDIASYLGKEGITALGIQELVVFEPEQIHILGSKSDLESFKEFMKTEK